MEEFGDWIYLLVIIVAGIASLISSTRKKARQVAEQNQPRQIITETSDGDDFWGDLLPQTENKPDNKIQTQQKAKPSYPSVINQPGTFLDYQKEGQSSIQQAEIQSMIVAEEYDNTTIDELAGNPDEWRKAFLYNEIFNRKN